MRRIATILTLSLVFCGMTAGAEQTMESVEKELQVLWTKVTSFSATITSDTSVSMGPATVKSHGTGTIECVRTGEKSKYRMDLVNKMDAGLPVGGAMEQKMISVFDGTNVYNEIEMMGMRQAMKMSADSAGKESMLTGKSMLDSLRERGEVKLLPDATVDGKPSYVFEVTPNDDIKGQAPSPVSIIKSYIAKDNGLQTKLEVFDDKGQIISSTTYTNVKTNVEFAPERFIYKAPEGVTVQDMSDMKIPGAK